MSSSARSQAGSGDLSTWRHLAPASAGAIALLYLLAWFSAVALADVRVDPSVATAAAGPTASVPAPAPAEPAPVTPDPTSSSSPSSASTSASAHPYTTSSTSSPSSSSSSDYAFLDCVRRRESRGDYRAVNPSGASGAYQLMPATARAVAMRAGRPDLAAIPAAQWSPADQDVMALVLYRWRGAAPWGGGCW